MTTYATQNPYELWDTRRSLGVMRDVKAETFMFSGMFTEELNSTDEYIDFEKLPIRKRKLAPFALPLARGGAIYEDSQRTYRFKPAYVKVEDTVDPLMPLTKRAGIDSSMLDPSKLTPMQRLSLIKTAITASHVDAITRTWEWLAARAVIDGKVTLTGKDYPTVLVDFQRDAGQTVTLTSGNYFGDTGVSIVSFFQSVVDTMNNAEFGAMPTKAIMGQAVWNVVRQDAEFKSHMDMFIKGGNITIERGLVSGGANGAKVFKAGEMAIGGGSGTTIELWVNNETYLDASGTSQRYLATNEIVFVGEPSAIGGYRCFGMIVDRMAEYQALPIFPNNWLAGNNPQVEWLGHTSAPLMVPINANATFKAKVVA